MVRPVMRVLFLSFILFLNLNLSLSLDFNLNLSLPSAAHAAEWTYLGNDGDGTYYYWVESQPSPGVVRVWGHLVYSKGGREAYMAKRKGSGMSVDGFDNLNHRNVLYEMNCFSERGEYAILEVIESTKDGKKLDYAKSGTYKDWSLVPDGSMLDKLSQAACPPKRK